MLRGHAGETLSTADVLGQLLAIELVEKRLVIEQIHLGRCATLEEIDDAFGFGREVRESREAAERFRVRGGEEGPREQIGERKGPDSARGGGEEVAAGDSEWVGDHATIKWLITNDE